MEKKISWRHSAVLAFARATLLSLSACVSADPSHSDSSEIRKAQENAAKPRKSLAKSNPDP